ncbi:hypothetical protein ACA910_022521 [Epithemia clementina (nom. ined.)]
MFERPTSITYTAALITLLLAISCSVVADEIFEKFDLNHDGSLGKDEFFDTADLNHDGSLDTDEFQHFSSKFQALLKQPLAAASPAAVSLLNLSWASLSSFKGFWKAFTSSFAMILATEVGDKTFFIAAILSMKHARAAVFSGALGALIIMTILSTAMGLVLPTFLPRKYTHWLGGILFLYFGIKLLHDSRGMDAGKASEELEEVEEELGGSSNKKADVEEGDQRALNRKSSSSGTTTKNWYQVALQSFTLTFIAEWGDRSQIATIALAAAKNPIGVTIGGTLGHSLCTGAAVLGGRMIASRISEKTVSQVGGIIFCVFGVHSLFFETE